MEQAATPVSTEIKAYRCDRTQFAIVTAGTLLLLFVAMIAADLPAAEFIHTHNAPDWLKLVLMLVRLPGHIGFTAAVMLLIGWRCAGRWREAFAVLLCGGIASAITAVLKWVLGRHRPYRGFEPFHWLPMRGSPFAEEWTKNLSFPSGDSTLAFATVAALAEMFPRYRAWFYFWAVLVAAARVTQGAHYPSDVIGGALVGWITTKLLWRFAYSSADSKAPEPQSPAITS